MGLVDKIVFENRGAHGSCDSDYAFALTTCCERVGVVDDELGDFYWSAETPSKSISLLDGAPCPFCDASGWELRTIDSLAQVPEHWRWACDSWPRPGSRRVLPLADHLRELFAFCERVASPLPVWNAVSLLDTKDPGVHYDRGWVVEQRALATVAQFSSRWDALLVAGYSWVNLSAYGIFRNVLIVGVEFPSERVGVPPGLTSVNYSGPARDAAGSPIWTLNVTVAR